MKKKSLRPESRITIVWENNIEHIVDPKIRLRLNVSCCCIVDGFSTSIDQMNIGIVSLWLWASISVYPINHSVAIYHLFALKGLVDISY